LRVRNGTRDTSSIKVEYYLLARSQARSSVPVWKEETSYSEKSNPQ